MYSVHDKLSVLRPRCTRAFYMKHGCLVAEAEIPHRMGNVGDVLKDIEEICRMVPVESASMGFWYEGFTLKYRARLSGHETEVRSRLSMKGWKYRPEVPKKRYHARAS